jgi:hypothetical protein
MHRAKRCAAGSPALQTSFKLVFAAPTDLGGRINGHLPRLS